MSDTNLTTSAWIPVPGGYASLDDVFHGERRFERLEITGHANRMNVFRLLRCVWYRVVASQNWTEEEVVRSLLDPEIIRTAYDDYMSTERPCGGTVRDSFDVIEGEYPFLQTKPFSKLSKGSVIAYSPKNLDHYDWEINQQSGQNHDPSMGIGLSGTRAKDEPMLTSLAMSLLGNYLSAYNHDSDVVDADGKIVASGRAGAANVSSVVGSLTFDLGDLLRSVVASSRYVDSTGDTAPWERPDDFGTFFHPDFFLRPAMGVVSAYFFPTRALRLVPVRGGYKIARAVNNQVIFKAISACLDKSDVVKDDDQGDSAVEAEGDASEDELIESVSDDDPDEEGDDSEEDTNAGGVPAYLEPWAVQRIKELYCIKDGKVVLRNGEGNFPAWSFLGAPFQKAMDREAGKDHKVRRDSFHIQNFTDTLYQIVPEKNGDSSRVRPFDPQNGGWTSLAMIYRSMREGQEGDSFRWAGRFLSDDSEMVVEYTYVISGTNTAQGAYTLYSRTEATRSFVAEVTSGRDSDSVVGSCLVAVDDVLRDFRFLALDRELHRALHPTDPKSNTTEGYLQLAIEGVDRGMQRAIRETSTPDSFVSMARKMTLESFLQATDKVRRSYPPSELLRKRRVGRDVQRNAVSVISEIEWRIRKAMSPAPTMMDSQEGTQ